MRVLLVQILYGWHTTNSNFLVGVCYRPPNIKDEEQIQLLSRIKMARRHGNVIIMGDFNYPDIDWTNGTAHSVKACHFLNLLQNNLIDKMIEA